MEILDNILKERGAQYGSFEDNMALVAMLYEEILPSAELSSYLCRLDIEQRHTESIIAYSTVRFARTMLALKATRSLTATGESYKDCIYDFLNYKKLCEGVLSKICSNQVEEYFVFTKPLFNQQQDADMTWIVNKEATLKKFDDSIYKMKE